MTDILVNTAHFPKTLVGEPGRRCFQIRGAWVMIYGCARHTMVSTAARPVCEICSIWWRRRNGARRALRRRVRRGSSASGTQANSVFPRCAISKRR